jgi:hypothetical protein
MRELSVNGSRTAEPVQEALTVLLCAMVHLKEKRKKGQVSYFCWNVL